LPVAVIAGALLAAVGAATTYWLAGAIEPAPRPTLIAVLPFENVSPTAEDAYFGIGMQDAIVSQLTKLNALSVLPVRSVDGQPSSQADLEGLNVSAALSGAVYYSEERVRVTPRLIDVATGVSLWSNSYERELRDIFAIQSEIAIDVAGALRLELSVGERERIEQLPTIDGRARDFYLVASARDLFSPREVQLAIAEAEEVLALDPAFSEAWLLYARIRGAAQTTDPEHLDEHRRIGEAAARKAAALDPELGDAFAVIGGTLQTKTDWLGAEAAYRKALSLNVPLAEMGSYAMLQLYAGKHDALALDIFEQARAGRPQNETMHRFLAFTHSARGELAWANDLYDLALRRFGDNDLTVARMLTQKMHWLVGYGELAKARELAIVDALNVAMLANLDDPEQALTELHHAYAGSMPGNTNRRRDIALWAGHFGDAQLAFAALRSAVDEWSAQMAYAWLPQLAPMRRLPDFEEYMREIGMVKYWQEYGWPTEFCRPLAGDDFECR
jgi:TolB-like protein